MGFFNKTKELKTENLELKRKLERILKEKESLEDDLFNLKQEIKYLKNKNQILEKENDSLKIQIEKSKQKTDKPSSPVTVFNNYELTDEQLAVFNVMENTRDNYFITGKAGTGKSTVLSYFKQTTKKKGVAIVAPTGAAALNVNGQTIHSLFKLDFEPQDTHSKSKVSTNPAVLDVLRSIKMLIIDEISMVRADVMDMIDAKLRLANKNDLPFGGCQIIAFGDLYQLPPVAVDRIEKDFIISRYNTLFFFGAPAVKETFKIIELTKVLRQRDAQFINILNRVRDGSVTTSDIDLINSRCVLGQIPNDCLKLVLTRNTAKRINEEKLSMIKEKEWIYETELEGNNPPSKEDVPFDFTLRLKIGAKIMTVYNDPAKQYINGSIGEVVDLSTDVIKIKIDNKICDVNPILWMKKIYRINKTTGELDSEVVGWAKQFPLRLAYAITVHKSQGQTYDQVVIDYSNNTTFANGQTYVAISRCRTLQGLYLVRPLTKQDININTEVTQFIKTQNNQPVKQSHEPLPVEKETKFDLSWTITPEDKALYEEIQSYKH